MATSKEEQRKIKSYDRWQKFVDLMVIFTAVGMTFLIVFAMLQASRRTDQLRDQIEKNQKVLSIVESIARSSEDNVRDHREAALRQHCATAQLVARQDGRVNEDEASLIRLACRH